MQLPALEPPKYYSPFDARAKLMNLQNLALQQQEGQQQLQLGKLNIDEHNRALARQQATDAAFKNAYTVDENGRPQLDEGRLTKDLSLAGFGSAATPILEAHTKYQKSLADLADTRSKVALLEQDAAGHLAAGVQAGNNDAHLFVTHVRQAVDSGAITPAHAKALTDPVIASLDADPTGEQARALVGQITTQMIQASPKERELATAKRTSDSTVQRNTAQAGAADATTKQKQLELAGQTAPGEDSNQQAWTDWRDKLPDTVKPLIPPMFSPAAVALVKSQGLTLDQQRQAKQAADALAEKKKVDAANMGNSETELAVIATNPNETPERRAAAGAALKRLDQSKMASRPVNTFQIPGLGGQGGQAGGGASQSTGEEYLSSLPQATAAQIRAIAEGRTNMPPATSRQPAALALRDAVFKFDPTFNEQRAQIRKAFTTGPDGRNIGNLNTAPVHLDQLYDAAMAMKNGTFQPGNAAWNKLSTIFGSSMPTNFDALKVTVSGEMANALKGVATDPEIAHINETLDRAKSPEQLAGVVQEDLQSIAGKLKTYLERAQQQDVGKWSPVLPS
ncbi:MAG TPA: hypothetical protein VNM37_04550, partial [Candidatus Dormibacteraeota bacterium]|nr:hypothetical protein [Candidatus Dormibacteraeota bacterium]